MAHRAGTPRGYLGLAAHPSLFGLAPCGVYPAPDVTAGAVRSYRTFSPLPCALRRRRYLLCGTSRLGALTLRSRTLSGTLPCGVRTFLSRSCDRQRPPSCSLIYRIAQVCSQGRMRRTLSLQVLLIPAPHDTFGQAWFGRGIVSPPSSPFYKELLPIMSAHSSRMRTKGNICRFVAVALSRHACLRLWLWWFPQCPGMPTH